MNDQVFDSETQKRLNTPLIDQSNGNAQDQEFLALVVKKINDGEINLYKPDTLFNSAAYEKLSDEAKGKADLEAVNMLSSLREIKGLYDSGNQQTYQMEYLVATVRHTKERIEHETGDIFII